MKLELSKEMEDLGFVVIEPVIVRKIKKSSLIVEADKNSGVCRLISTDELYTMQASGVRIFENDLAEPVWCIEKRFLECKCILDEDEETMTFEEYQKEIANIKKDTPVYTGVEKKIILPGE